ncbi:hypothetical protein FND50_12625 [Rhodococcus sp. WB9]|uniref:hypothetical protein n=1 Tax=Rhodococcus sp. WB9 TaxID=2594007 RepID=UPI0011863A92|nr:hypothetical protein [Rhodococcus sp. WB9]QDQ91578.1 hypothetical protein FND50_12625 [Rhodococcus sp. WB9]
MSENKSEKNFEADAMDYANKVAVKRHGRFLDRQNYVDYLEEDGYAFHKQTWSPVSALPAQPGQENWFKQFDGSIRKEPVLVWLVVENRHDYYEKGNNLRRVVAADEIPERSVVAGTLNDSLGEFGPAHDIKNYVGTFPAGYVKPTDPDDDDIYGREW